MEHTDAQKKSLPLSMRLLIVSAVYFFLIVPSANYVMNKDMGEFLTLFLINLLFVAPLLLFLNVSSFAQDMTAFLRFLCRWIDILNHWVGKGVAWVTLLLVVLVFVDVVMRYVLRISFVFVQELEWHLFAFIFLVGAGCTLLKDGHVRVDIIYQRLGPKGQAWVNLIGVLFFLLPGCYLIIATSIKFVYNAWIVMEGSPDPGGIPCRFIIKSAIPIGFALVTLQGISMGIKSLFTILEKDIEKKKDKTYHLERDCRS